MKRTKIKGLRKNFKKGKEGAQQLAAAVPRNGEGEASSPDASSDEEKLK
jgi:hypothetical protein